MNIKQDDWSYMYIISLVTTFKSVAEGIIILTKTVNIRQEKPKLTKPTKPTKPKKVKKVEAYEL